MKRLLIVLIITPLLQINLFAGEGMWLPLFLQALNEGEMQSMGMKMSAEDIYSVNKGSLKDAIVHFGGFCTAEVISGSGLLLTNHHCGYRQIQSHSSVDNNLLKDGFWADGTQEELPNPGLFAKFIESIEDVSIPALAGVTEAMNAKERQSIIDKNIVEIRSKYDLKEFEEITIKPFFHGNQYFLFKTVSYYDVRLVGTPPESIGKFGADTDNWIWPRHTGDFSLFRIYAGPNNEPAAYSPDNKPYTPKHFLPISLDGITEDDFTLIFGFPGRTNEYLPSNAIEQMVEKTNPAKIAIRDKALKIIDKYMRADEAIRLQYASKFASVANYWKKWIGESQGLKSSGAVAKKKAFEKDFQSRVNKNPSQKEAYGDLLNQFEKEYNSIGDLAYANDYFSEYIRNVELLKTANYLKTLAKNQKAGNQEKYNSFKKRLTPVLIKFYKDYQPSIDQEIFAALSQMYFENVDSKHINPAAKEKLLRNGNSYEKFAASIFGQTFIKDESKMMATLDLPMDEAVKTIEADPLFQYLNEIADYHKEKVGIPKNEIQSRIDVLMRKFMKAQMEVFPDEKFYPDANSTMRVTYGQVKGYEPRDAVHYNAQTYLDGVIQKYVPGDYEFDLPKKLISLHEQKDYGQYAQDGKIPVCFLGTNHTTGGNSGSPAIDAYGNLVGLNFDRVWEGTMSDFNYDPSICRNIMVDTRYILFIVDKFAGASHLIDEMKLVRPKSAPVISKPATKVMDSKLKNKRRRKGVPRESKHVMPETQGASGGGY